MKTHSKSAALLVLRSPFFQAMVFLCPFLLINLVFLIYPFIKGIWMSLHHWELLSTQGTKPTFIGLSNYAKLFSDPFFWSSLVHTLEFAAIAVPIITMIGLALALLLNHTGFPYTFLRGLFFSSGAFSVTVVTLIWLTVFSPTRGLVGQLFRLIGITPIDFLNNRAFAMTAIVITTVWWSIGFPMALFLAGLQQIPREIYEAAELDHASSWTVLRKITLPALKRTTWIVILIQVVSQFQIFGQVLLMTRGGPANSTRVLVQYIYEKSFRDWQVGYASAISMVLFFAMMMISLLQFKFSKTSP
ncbi:MAG: sugar ABC transporter permease [Bdellovibrionia bacterium]